MASLQPTSVDSLMLQENKHNKQNTSCLATMDIKDGSEDIWEKDWKTNAILGVAFERSSLLLHEVASQGVLSQPMHKHSFHGSNPCI